MGNCVKCSLETARRVQCLLESKGNCTAVRGRCSCWGADYLRAECLQLYCPLSSSASTLPEGTRLFAENVLDFLPLGRESRFPVRICEGTCTQQSTRYLETKGEQLESRVCKTEMTPVCAVWGPGNQNVFLAVAAFEGKSITEPWHKQRVKLVFSNCSCISRIIHEIPKSAQVTISTEYCKMAQACLQNWQTRKWLVKVILCFTGWISDHHEQEVVILLDPNLHPHLPTWLM